MKTESEPLSAQESIALITSMINQAKGNAKQKSFYFLLWGWTILICDLSIYVMLRFLHVHFPFWVWLLTIPAAIISGIYGRSQQHKGNVTHLDQVNKWLWIGFGIICFTIVGFGYRINFQITPVIIVMCAIPTFVTGIMLKFRPLIMGGISFWVLGIITFLLPTQEQFLLAAIAIAIGYLVPGYLLKSRKA